MNKKEFKARYSAARALHDSIVGHFMKDWHSDRKEVAVAASLDAIEKLGMLDIMLSRSAYVHYPIKDNKWAISLNHRGY